MTSQYFVPNRSQVQIEALVAAFEAGTLPTIEFNHYAHMTVALWYLTRLSYPEAVTAMRSSIQHYAAAHHHDQLYHETITLFWMKVLKHYTQNAEAGLAFPNLVHGALTQLGDKQLMFKHYSRALLFSTEAREKWVEPDVVPFSFETKGL